MLMPDQIEKIRNHACRQKHIAAIYVFGSIATGKDRWGSDIDLAVMVCGELSGMKRVEMETTLSNLLGRDVDVVIFGKSSALLQHQILKYGRLIYEANPPERIRQEVQSRRNYLDTTFLYKKIGWSGCHGGS